jgi:hypothetical protein
VWILIHRRSCTGTFRSTGDNLRRIRVKAIYSTSQERKTSECEILLVSVVAYFRQPNFFPDTYVLHLQARSVGQGRLSCSNCRLLLLGSCMDNISTLKIEAKISFETSGCLRLTWHHDLEATTLGFPNGYFPYFHKFSHFLYLTWLLQRVAMQRPRDGLIYQGRFRATAR